MAMTSDSRSAPVGGVCIMEETSKAQTSFQQLQERISALESQIADRREFYNDSVNTYNIRIDSIPDTFIAKSMNLKARELFVVVAADKEDVKVSFK